MLFLGLPFEFLSAFILTLCLAAFSMVTFWSISKARSARRSKPLGGAREPSIEESIRMDFRFVLAVVGTLTFGAMMLLHLLLAYTGELGLLQFLSLQAVIPFPFALEIIGLCFLVLGFLFFSWSVVVRTHGAGSGRLVTSGPFRFVRHPSYFSYFLMFIGLFLLWPNFFTLFSWVGIPGYFGIVSQEESFLVKHFGTEYREYQKTTGRLFPMLHRKKPRRSKR
jgi:protein-S-isoprenylcysteine O-methyltransferase Ste14